MRLPSFEPVQLLAKHQDWLFASAWLTDSILATGSRDSTVKLWSVNGRPAVNRSPVADCTKHKDKVRDLKYDALSQRLATLSSDATCKLWDPQLMAVIQSVPLQHKREVVCMALDYPLIAVGSQRFITFLDIRCGHVAHQVESADEGWGVRSLSFNSNILTCGGGKGRLSFLDIRAQQYLRLGDRVGDDRATPSDRGRDSSMCNYYYTTGKGSLEEGEVYRSHFAGQDVRHAVYAHVYDAAGLKLLVAGGPLPFGLRGCYVAVW